jgi:hypothetical protein
MQSTGQTSMQESSLMQLPVITYVMPTGYKTVQTRAHFGGIAWAPTRSR